MKTIILTRHAKSSWKFPELKDFDRPLKKRGLTDAPLMARVLKNQHVHVDRIVTSPAVRAMQTATIFAQELGIYEALIEPELKLYLASKSKLFKEILQFDDTLTTIILVAHNPGLTDLANFLLEEKIKNIPTSGMVGIGFDINSWKEAEKSKGKLLFFESPKKYRENIEEEEKSPTALA